MHVCVFFFVWCFLFSGHLIKKVCMKWCRFSFHFLNWNCRENAVPANWLYLIIWLLASVCCTAADANQAKSTVSQAHTHTHTFPATQIPHIQCTLYPIEHRENDCDSLRERFSIRKTYIICAQMRQAIVIRLLNALNRYDDEYETVVLYFVLACVAWELIAFLFYVYWHAFEKYHYAIMTNYIGAVLWRMLNAWHYYMANVLYPMILLHRFLVPSSLSRFSATFFSRCLLCSSYSCFSLNDSSLNTSPHPLLHSHHHPIYSSVHILLCSMNKKDQSL